MIDRKSLSIAGAGFVVLAIAIKLSVVDVPLFDEWLWAPSIVHAHLGTLTFADLWAQQNVHRSIVPTTIAVMLSFLGGWHQSSEAIVSAAVAAVTYLLAEILLRSGRSELSLGTRLACAALVFSLVQSENWTWGFQLSWFLVNAALLGVVVLLSRAHLRLANVLAAFFVAALATLTFVTGMYVLAAGLLLLVLRRDRSAASIAGWSIASCALMVLYLRGYVLPPNEAAVLGTASLANIAGFTLAYLGAPLSLGLPVAIPIVLGAGALIAFLATVRANMLRTDERERSVHIGWALVSGFALVCAVADAIGRANGGVDAALASRYTTAATLLWLPLVAYRPQRIPQRIRTGGIVALAALALLVNVYGAANMFGSHLLQAEAHDIVHDYRTASDDDLLLASANTRIIRQWAPSLERLHFPPFR